MCSPSSYSRIVKLTSVCAITFLWHARAAAGKVCAIADAAARESVLQQLQVELSTFASIELGSVWMFNFDQLPSDCLDCGNANPSSTYGCPRFASEGRIGRARETRNVRVRASSARVHDTLELEHHTLAVVDSPNLDFARTDGDNEIASTTSTRGSQLPRSTARGVLPTSCEWNLRQDEVVAIVGCTPDAMRYFGLTPYVYELNPSSPAATLVFSSLGDSFSTAESSLYGAYTRLSTDAQKVESGGVARMTSGPWNSTFVFLMGRNVDTMRRVADALTAQGLGDAINKAPVPPPPTPASYTMLFRGAMPRSEASWQRYVEDPPIHAFRITPYVEQTRNAYSAPPLITRDTVDESVLSNAHADLVAAVRDHVAGTPGRVATVTPSPRPQLVASNSQACLSFGINCGGDNRDTVYIRTAPEGFTLDDDPESVVYAVGVNHALTANAHYLSVSLYDAARRLAVLSIDDDNLADSAQPWLSAQSSASSATDLASKLYVVAFARACERHVLPPGTPCVNVPVSGFPSAAYDARLQLWERPYCTRDTTIGPWWTTLVLPTVVHSIPAPPISTPAAPNPFLALFQSF